MDAMRVVDIETEFFDAQAIYYGDMPLMDMLKLSDAHDPVQKVQRWHNLMTKVILDPAKIVEFECLSLDEAMLVCSLYLKQKPYELVLDDFI